MKKRILLALTLLFGIFVAGLGVSGGFAALLTGGDGWTISAGALVAFVVLGAIIAASLLRFIANPIDQLVAATRRLEAGDLTHRVEYDDGTEFGELARSFNTMAGALETAHQRLLSEFSRRRSVEADLALNNDRFALAAQGSRDGLWDWNVSADSIHFSPRCSQILGLEDDDLDDFSSWHDCVHPDDRNEFVARIGSFQRSAESHFDLEVRMIHACGEFLWILLRGTAVRDESGSALRMAGAMTDVTNRRRNEEDLRHNALHHPLTGLPNGALLLDRLRQADAHRRGSSIHGIAVLHIDLDRFKIYNETLGRKGGNSILRSVAAALRSEIRSGDTVASLGGDEFVVVAANIDSDTAVRYAHHFERLLRKPFEVDERIIRLSASIGVVFDAKGEDSAEEMLRFADIAMHRAKQLRGRKVLTFDRRIHLPQVSVLGLEHELLEALDRDEFCLFYQPILGLEDGTVAGLEALIRWRHPVHGLISPNAFVPIAEETGAIIAIGLAVTKIAFRQAAIWNSDPLIPPVFVSVNVSACQLESPDFVQTMGRLIKETGIDPAWIKLELTESAVIGNPDFAASRLEELGRLGFQLCLDDFGTGQASFGYLERMSFCTLKIDRLFLEGIDSRPKTGQIFRSIVDLARRLDMTIVAEGIDTAEKLARVRFHGCDYAQGFLVSQPLETAEASTFLTEQRRLPEAATSLALH